MSIHSLLVVPFLLSALAAPDLREQWNGPATNEDRYVTTVPFTYVIGYHDWLSDEASMRSLKEAPPDLLHINQPVPLNCNLIFTKGFWGRENFENTFLTQEQYQERVEKTKAYVKELRTYGVQWIIPYVNSCILLGDPDRRSGFWDMYDHWDRVEWLLGPKPTRDPVLWCGVPRRSLDPWKPYPEYPEWRYEPSAADPDWRHFLERCVEELAACGYDGTFVDDCIMESRSQVDQDRFPDYVASRPSAQVLTKPLQLGYPGQGLLYAESVRYWYNSVTELLDLLRNAGRKQEPDFFVLPNWGSISRPLGLLGRETTGKSLESWSRVARLIMLEENYGPGRIVPGSILSYALQYKQCLALGVQPALLPYVRGRYPAELAYAEVTAGGGGAFIESSRSLDDLRKAYGTFFRNHADLLAGLQPWSQVGLLYDTDECHYGHDAHISDAMRMGRALLDAHVQFDVILKKDLLTPHVQQYDTIILPNVSRLSGAACEALKQYLKNRGQILATGDIATHDELNRERKRQKWGLHPWIIRGMTENDCNAESGHVTYVKDLSRLVQPTSIDVEMLTDILEDVEPTVENLKKQSVGTEPHIHPYWSAFIERYQRMYLKAELPPEVRVHVYYKPGGPMTIHFVNYCVSPWEPNESTPPEPIKKCRIWIKHPVFQTSESYTMDVFNGRGNHPGKLAIDSWTVYEIEYLKFHRMIVIR